jgi:hypothetical protein
VRGIGIDQNRAYGIRPASTRVSLVDAEPEPHSSEDTKVLHPAPIADDGVPDRDIAAGVAANAADPLEDRRYRPSAARLKRPDHTGGYGRRELGAGDEFDMFGRTWRVSHVHNLRRGPDPTYLVCITVGKLAPLAGTAS